MDGFRFSTELTARFNETDAQGIIHHGVHVIWFEIARIAYLEQVAGGYSGLVGSGVDGTTIEMNIRYREAVRLGDRLRHHIAGHPSAPRTDRVPREARVQVG